MNLTDALLFCVDKGGLDYAHKRDLRKFVFGSYDSRTVLSPILTLQDNLKQTWGMDAFEIVGKGAHSLAFASNNKVIRLRFTGTELPDVPEKAKPFCAEVFDTGNVNGLHYDVTEKLNQEDVTREDALLMFMRLADADVRWADVKKENIGKDDAGNMKLLDMDRLSELLPTSSIHRNATQATRHYIDVDHGPVPSVFSDEKNVLVVLPPFAHARFFKTLEMSGVIEKNKGLEDTPLIRIRNRLVDIGGHPTPMEELVKSAVNSIFNQPPPPATGRDCMSL